MSSDDDRPQTSLLNFQRSALGGVLVSLPVLALVALDAPQRVTFGYLVLVVLVLTPYVIWQRRRSLRRNPYLPISALPTCTGSSVGALTELRSEVVAEADHRVDPSSEKAQRREARAMVGTYHQEQLRALLEQVRAAFDRLDAGDIDEFELDTLIHRYKRAARQLWTFCESSGGQSVQAAAALTYMRDRGEERDWWAESARRRDVP